MTVDPYWNHNTHYHPWLVQQVPESARTALDVGCGDGLLAGKLATRCESVLGVDIDGAIIAGATTPANVRLTQADFRELDQTFDLVTVVATLHHVPLAEGMAALRDLVAPGGTLAVVGLWKMSIHADAAYLPLLPVIWAIGQRHGGSQDPGFTCRDPDTTLAEIRAVGGELLPGARIRRRLLWRYTLLWRKPA
ncbi:class I SAM-dependent methyltransferase [Nocardia cyriacigeorgica]|uniref:Class I SAM-dependent methyltransferase n=1 Tax=Nocardia cyriacigeorgica TaxID=135487 RepID=A0A6P1D4H5_9NOCA|nr:class I SAM-dependent methyltransferase [Nocardia cyriacigeorgica]NEW37461.1 class I SAM-dependent methyltransferase [Nocardia cyriacigeorgica]NEW44938.1 class I SAM-dependent methyltransferase [Nocardia cyriacigeorgica]NEW49151.1 class I SAM-dependent methyltransferase [Nocardia cyriacigeorgica]NEW56647.1 class I SAM-dependent methyltransferase [Nocardia cyriacigeorgica]